MFEGSTTTQGLPTAAEENVATIPAPGRDVLTGILRDGAQRLLGQAIQAEVDSWIEQHAQLTSDEGRRQVVRNGHHRPARW